MNKVVSDAMNIVYKFIMPLCAEKCRTSIEHNLLSIAGLNEFHFSEQLVHCDSYLNTQSLLARINEKESIRKNKGVYYTPSDVVKFIVANSVKAAYGTISPDTIRSSSLEMIEADSFCLSKSIFEPTCGAGEFLLEALECKLDIWKQKHTDLKRAEINKIVSTIYGNDINRDSVIITKLRLFLCVAYRCGVEFCTELSEILNQNFTTFDYVSPVENDTYYDIIVGNPPYVEDSKCGLTLGDHYGNIYANVLVNAANRLNKGGSMGFIVPISYSSTPRMKKLRDRLREYVQEQYILCYADRPDCLFDAVHQKLCILICRNKEGDPSYFTSNYQYWYQEERSNLFSNTHVILNCFERDDCIPKLGTPLDLSIYQKIMMPQHPTVYSISGTGMHSIYVNRRETFWIKAFRQEIIHPEYKVFSYSTPGEADYCYCLVNSSLFWWYWISVSDCWHVSRELNGFRAPVISDFSQCTILADALDTRLEETKEYVGTKQTDFEYKHRACLKEIHAIDDFVNSTFGLTKEESDYIKEFALRYRISGGALSSEGN